jgi:hypothetical protein
MAKKNRAPRPKIDDMYLNAGEVIPGLGILADHDGWYTPELMEGFDRVKYREWKQEMIRQWREKEALDA